MTSEQQIIAAQAAEIERLKNRVASLEDQLYWLRKKMFGKMSEKNLPLDPSVLSEPTLFDEPLTEQERAELDARVKKEEEEEASLIKVRSFERKPRKALDLSGLEEAQASVWGGGKEGRWRYELCRDEKPGLLQGQQNPDLVRETRTPVSDEEREGHGEKGAG